MVRRGSHGHRPLAGFRRPQVPIRPERRAVRDRGEHRTGDLGEAGRQRGDERRGDRRAVPPRRASQGAAPRNVRTGDRRIDRRGRRPRHRRASGRPRAGLEVLRRSSGLPEFDPAGPREGEAAGDGGVVRRTGQAGPEGGNVGSDPGIVLPEDERAESGSSYLGSLSGVPYGFEWGGVTFLPSTIAVTAARTWLTRLSPFFPAGSSSIAPE